MPSKEKTPKTRKPKVSGGVHGAGGKGRPLSDLEKILIGNGGMAHRYLRGNAVRFGSPKRRFTRSDKKEAREL